MKEVEAKQHWLNPSQQMYSAGGIAGANSQQGEAAGLISPSLAEFIVLALSNNASDALTLYCRDAAEAHRIAGHLKERNSHNEIHIFKKMYSCKAKVEWENTHVDV